MVFQSGGANRKKRDRTDSDYPKSVPRVILDIYLKAPVLVQAADCIELLPLPLDVEL